LALSRGGQRASPQMQRPTKRGGNGPVPVVYFPKNARGEHPRVSQTITELRAFDEAVTESSAAVAAIPDAPQSLRKVSGERKRRRTKEPALPENTLAGVASGRKTPREVADLALFGHQLFELGRVDEARVIFEGLVATGAKDAFTHTMLGTIYLALKDQVRALTLFQLALEIDPGDVSALVYRGEIRLNRGKVKGGLEDLTRAVKLGSAEDPFVERAKRLLRMAKTLLKRARR
jgi:tetratricopeptide (TPR) repeat protein